MKNFLLAAFAAAAFAQSALADPVIVFRPTSGSGAIGVLPQNAFSPSGGPTVPPVTPPVNPPTSPVVFTSVGFGMLPTGDSIAGIGEDREYGMPWGNPYCTVIDSAANDRDSKMFFSYYPGAGQNTPAILIRPYEAGVYEIVVSCGQSQSAHSPTAQFSIVVS